MSSGRRPLLVAAARTAATVGPSAPADSCTAPRPATASAAAIHSGDSVVTTATVSARPRPAPAPRAHAHGSGARQRRRSSLPPCTRRGLSVSTKPQAQRPALDRQAHVALAGEATDLDGGHDRAPVSVRVGASGRGRSRRRRRPLELGHQGGQSLVRRAHQGLAHEERPGSGRAPRARASAAVTMPLSLDQQHVARRKRREAFCHPQVDGEGTQVAVVDADQRGARGDRSPELGFVVHLDQGVEADRRHSPSSSGQAAVVERRGDEQHGGGARRGGLPDLVGIDHEILAQHRQRDGRGDRLEVGQRAAEAPRLGEHRDGVGPGGCVGAAPARRRRAPARWRPCSARRA